MTNRVVYKWGPIEFGGTTIKGRVVHIGFQNGDVFVWTEQELDVNIKYFERTVKLQPTGVEYTGKHLGTAVMPSGLVWHVVENNSQPNKLSGKSAHTIIVDEFVNYGQGAETRLEDK
jgi:hypothetical protein